MLRKAFPVDPVSAHGKVVSARIYSTGLGWNDMTMNGAKTEPNTWMNPGFTAYDQTVLYTTDDVTALIQQDATAPKTNVVATQLAAGRYNTAYNGQNHAFDFAQWRAQEVLRADLYVKYADGTEQLIKTDPTWQVSIDGPVRISDYYDGETFDARRQIPGSEHRQLRRVQVGVRQRHRGPQGQGLRPTRGAQPARQGRPQQGERRGYFPHVAGVRRRLRRRYAPGTAGATGRQRLGRRLRTGYPGLGRRAPQ